MGFYYRKSVNLGPFRVNLSKSGVGYSVGGRSPQKPFRNDHLQKTWRALRRPRRGIRAELSFTR